MRRRRGARRRDLPGAMAAGAGTPAVSQVPAKSMRAATPKRQTTTKPVATVGIAQADRAVADDLDFGEIKKQPAKVELALDRKRLGRTVIDDFGHIVLDLGRSARSLERVTVSAYDRFLACAEQTVRVTRPG